MLLVLLAWLGLIPKRSQGILERTVQGGHVSEFIL